MARKFFLWSSVDDDSAKYVVTRLLSLDSEDSSEEIVLYINSPGGAVHDGMAIYDAMQAISAPVSTVCTGLAASMGAVLLACGQEGRRFTWPHARIMIHQPSGGYHGSAADVEVAAKEILHIREKLNHIIADHTGQSVDKISEDVDRDRFMSPAEAVDYGLIDSVLEGPVQTTESKPADSDTPEAS
mgnify:CR=1 FL=1